MICRHSVNYLNNTIPVRRNDTDGSTIMIEQKAGSGTLISASDPFMLVTVIVRVRIVGMIGPVADHTTAEHGGHYGDQRKNQYIFLFHNGHF